MKKKLTKKLSINKEIVSSLNKEEAAIIIGGQEDITTSFTNCTGWGCCGQDGTGGSAACTIVRCCRPTSDNISCTAPSSDPY